MTKGATRSSQKRTPVTKKVSSKGSIKVSAKKGSKFKEHKSLDKGKECHQKTEATRPCQAEKKSEPKSDPQSRRKSSFEAKYNLRDEKDLGVEDSVSAELDLGLHDNLEADLKNSEDPTRHDGVLDPEIAMITKKLSNLHISSPETCCLVDIKYALVPKTSLELEKLDNVQALHVNVCEDCKPGKQSRS